ncbi:MAG: hypothetical protein ABIB71_00020 [Candidatus Woesearchaeota archaeon]
MDNKIKLISFVARGKRRITMLEFLSKKSSPPSEIASDLKISLSNCCTCLKKLAEKKLVEPINMDRTFRFYRITPLGRNALAEAKKLKEKIKGLKK